MVTEERKLDEVNEAFDVLAGLVPARIVFRFIH